MCRVLAQRILSAVVLLPLVLVAAYLGGLYFAVVVAAFALLGNLEFFRMVRHAGHSPYEAMGLSLAAVLLVDGHYPHLGLWRFGIAVAVIFPMVWQIMRQDTHGFLTNWALTLVGALYVGGLAAHMILLRNLPRGLTWLLLTFLVTWVCDTGAYFAGIRWGKRGFFVHISPHKTWEGAIGGFVSGLVAALLVGHWAGLVWWQSLGLGVLLVPGVIFGDLAESLLKRQVGVKDSGTLIPGHGGALDRVDSLLFAGTITYYFLVWLVL